MNAANMNELFREGMNVNELANFFMSLNNSSIRQAKSPLSLSHFKNTGDCLTIEMCDNRNHVSLAIPQSEYESFQSPILHNHDYFEFMFVLEGTLQMQIEDSFYTYHQGDVCLFDRNIHHAEIQQQNTSITYCCITKAFLDNWPKGSMPYDPSENKCMMRFFQNQEEQPGSPNQFAEFRSLNKTGAELISSHLDVIRRELIQQETGALLILCGMFTRLLHTLTDPHLYDYNCVTLKTESLVDEVRNYIESSPGRVSREEIAAALHYNSDYLNRIFRQRVGMTLSAYCTYTYMKKAASLLLQTDDTIEEIAAAIGFSNPSQFYRQFRNFFHMTPQTYRSMCSKLLDGEAEAATVRP